MGIDDCNKSGEAIDETKIKGTLSIEDLLQKDFDKHVGAFEIPDSVKNIIDVDGINAVITWYLKWKLTEKIDNQNTCTIKNLFGYEDGLRVIVAINFYKYLRNKGYDPDIVEVFLKTQ